MAVLKREMCGGDLNFERIKGSGTDLNRRKQKFLAPAVILLIFLVIWKKTGIFFETNDDKYITEILSGAYTGTPNAHVGHISYLLSLPISLLYRVTNKVPWYGFFLIFAQALAYVGVLKAFTTDVEIIRR